MVAAFDRSDRSVVVEDSATVEIVVPEGTADLPCPWCYSPTSETDQACPTCGQPFG